MKKMVIILFIHILIIGTGCVAIEKYIPAAGEEELDQETIIAGLKEALEIGTKNAVGLVSKEDGYYKNPEITIPLPEDLEEVADTVRKVGLKKEVDEFIETMNRGAEEAAKEAIDIFVKAISKMTIQDALNILNGPDDAATKYFEKNTRKQLYDAFRPVITKVLDSVGVTALFKLTMDTYNSIPLTKKVEFDLDDYVTNKALDGLFIMIAKEEKQIRIDPVARVTELLRKVFGRE